MSLGEAKNTKDSFRCSDKGEKGEGRLVKKIGRLTILMKRQERKFYLDELEKRAIRFINAKIPRKIEERIFSEFPATIFYDKKENESLCSSCGHTFTGKPQNTRIKIRGACDRVSRVKKFKCPLCKAAAEIKEARRYKRIMLSQEGFASFTRRDRDGICIVNASIYNRVYAPTECEKMRIERSTIGFAAMYKDENTSIVVRKKWLFPNVQYRRGGSMESYIRPVNYLTRVVGIVDFESAEESTRNHKKPFFRNTNKNLRKTGKEFCYAYVMNYDVIAEGLLQSGLRKLSAEYLNGRFSEIRNRSNAKTREELLGLPTPAIKAMCRYDTGVMAYERILEFYKKAKRNLTVQEWDAYVNILTNTTRYGNAFSFGGVDILPHLPVREIVKQHAGNWNEWNTYFFDYIEIARKLGMEITDKKVLCPLDIEAAHDKVTEEFHYEETRLTNEMIAERIESIKELEDQGMGFILTLPRKAAEIKREGKLLGHCVKNYIDEYANGETILLFLRREESPREPFITVEYRDGKIVQARGDHNIDPPEDARKFLKAWSKRQQERNPVHSEKAVQVAA